MALFKKKSDPLSERARDLQRQISELEEEIQRLNELQSGSQSVPTPPPPTSKLPPKEIEITPQPPRAKPRLRSTAHPHGPTILNPKSTDAPSSSHEPIFEEVEQNPFRNPSPPIQEQGQELGIRRDDFLSTWKRLKNHFRGPVASNPKLVNYLAAGSIQGLRPLRYERRVARNRFIVLAVILVLVLLGIFSLLLKR